MCVVTFSWKEPDSMKKVREFEKKRYAGWAVVEVTQACNMKCEWCYSNSPGIKSPKEIPKEQAHKLLKTLADSGVKQVTSSGGEPLLYSHIIDFVKTAHDYGLVVHMNTNGYFLDAKMARDLSRAGLSQVQMNIEGLDAMVHDAVRGTVKSHSRVLDAFKNAKENGITCCSQTVVTKQNIDKIPQIMRFIRELGLDRMRLWDVNPSGSAVGKEGLATDRFIPLLKEMAVVAKDLGAQHILSYEPLFPLGFKTPIPCSHIPCPSAKGFLVNVLTDGSVTYCAVVRENKLYNIFEHNDISQLHLDRIQLLRETSNAVPSCRSSCKYGEICGGGCLSRSAVNANLDYQCNKFGFTRRISQ